MEAEETGASAAPVADPRAVRIALAAVALSAAPAGAITAVAILPEFGWRALVVGLCTAALSLVAVDAALRRATSPASAARLGFGFAVLAAVANSPLSFAAVTLTAAQPRLLVLLPAGLAVATLFGALFVIPLGVVLGALDSVLAGAAFRLSRLGSYDAADRTLRISGLWLGLMDLACYGVARFTLAGAGSAGGVVEAVAAFAAAGSIAGFAAAAFAQESLRARRSWLRHVRAGLVEGWVVLPRAQVPATAPLRPFVAAAARSPSAAPASLLCRRGAASGKGAYRSAGENLEPVALVD